MLANYGEIYLSYDSIQMEKLCLQVFICQQVTRRNYRNRFLAKVCIEDTNQIETSCMNLIVTIFVHIFLQNIKECSEARNSNFKTMCHWYKMHVYNKTFSISYLIYSSLVMYGGPGLPFDFLHIFSNCLCVFFNKTSIFYLFF